MDKYSNIDEYICSFPEEVRKRLEEIRVTIKKEVPEVLEKISYGIPATTVGGKYFIYFAGYKKHISVYPVTAAIEENVKEALEYRTGKGTLQFSLSEPLPMDLIRKVIKVRFQEVKGSGR